MASEKTYLIDESTSGPLPAGYDLLLDRSINMEDYIEIKEKKLPGIKPSFNNMENAATKEVCVTGLLLHFSQDPGGSKLKSILRRTDIEYLFLYADTIIIGDKLWFPQANVTITCRRIIIEEQGTLSTTPEPYAQPYALGAGGDKRQAGAPGQPGGNIMLICNITDNRHPEGEAVFFLNGGKGQNGERGDVKKPSKTGTTLTWANIEDAVLKHDIVVGKTSNWKWADFDNNKKDKIYYAKLQAYNFHFLNAVKEKELGDENAVNQDNGHDAIASGPGGNGGPGGNFYSIVLKKAGPPVMEENEGGEGGKSVKIEPGKKAKDSTYYHIVLRAYHHDAQYEPMDWLDFEKKYQPFCVVTKEVKSTDGKAAPANPDGQRGAKGASGWLPFDQYDWVSPVLLETVLGFAKENYRDGKRQRAKWILDEYAEGFWNLHEPLKENIQMAALMREVAMYQHKLAQNLDFYGYPPGWVPKLSARSNLDILINSRRELAELIYFASDLLERDDAREQEKREVEWTSEELKKGTKVRRLI